GPDIGDPLVQAGPDLFFEPGLVFCRYVPREDQSFARPLRHFDGDMGSLYCFHPSEEDKRRVGRDDCLRGIAVEGCKIVNGMCFGDLLYLVRNVAAATGKSKASLPGQLRCFCYLTQRGFALIAHYFWD